MNNFVEEYKNALSGDICDSLVKIFEDVDVSAIIYTDISRDVILRAQH